MKKLTALLSLTFVVLFCSAQPKIHSHNDYLQAKPLETALKARVHIIEADVFLVKGSLYVAHTEKEIDTTKSLESLYVNPLLKWVKENKNPQPLQLMIDVKGDWNKTYIALQEVFLNKLEYFDPKKNGRGVQIVISGNRPQSFTFHNFPSWLYFDGLPNVAYAKEDLDKVTMISDNFRNYTAWNGVGKINQIDQQKLLKVILTAAGLNKPMRFWNAPDDVNTWETLYKLGTGVINTDKIEACKAYFYIKKDEFER